MREINRFDEIIYSKLLNTKISEKSYLLKLKCFEKICKIPTSLSKSPLKISVQFEISSGALLQIQNIYLFDQFSSEIDR